MNFAQLLAKLLTLMTAIQNSPAFLAWLKDLFASVPAGAQAQVDPSDPDLKAALAASPDVEAALMDIAASSAPNGAQPIGIGGIATFLALLPQLKQLFDLLQQLFPKK